MEIQIRSTDGDVSRFAIKDEPRGLNLIESLTPSEFFSQPMLRIHGGKQTSIFSLKTVESIYFATSLKARIREQPPATDFKTVSETDYRETLQTLQRQYESLDNLFQRGQSIDILLSLHCLSGKIHYLRARVIAGLRVEQAMDLQTRLGRLISVIPCSPEGYIAINPAAIKRIELYPAPPESPLVAWLVD